MQYWLSQALHLPTCTGTCLCSSTTPTIFTRWPPTSRIWVTLLPGSNYLSDADVYIGQLWHEEPLAAKANCCSGSTYTGESGEFYRCHIDERTLQSSNNGSNGIIIVYNHVNSMTRDNNQESDQELNWKERKIKGELHLSRLPAKLHTELPVTKISSSHTCNYSSLEHVPDTASASCSASIYKWLKAYWS